MKLSNQYGKVIYFIDVMPALVGLNECLEVLITNEV